MPDRTTTAPTAPHEPGPLSMWLVKTCALDMAAHHASADPDPNPPANRPMYHALTATIDAWEREGDLHELLLLTVEHLAVRQCGQLAWRYNGDWDRVDEYLDDFAALVAAAQQHDHPAGPTAVAMLRTVCAHSARSGRPLGRTGLALLAAPILAYLRPDRRVEDARELVLTLGLWTGQDLADLAQWDKERIAASTAYRVRVHANSGQRG